MRGTFAKTSFLTQYQSAFAALVLALFFASCRPTILGVDPISGNSSGNFVKKISGDKQSLTVSSNSESPLVAQFLRDGQAIAGENVEWIASNSNATLATADTVTSSEGFARAQILSSSIIGNVTITARLAGNPDVSASFDITVTPGAATKFAIVSGDYQTAAASTELESNLIGRVTDAFGNPVANIAVNWSVPAGDAQIISSTSTSDTQGLVTAKVKTGTAIVLSTVSASYDNDDSQSISADFSVILLDLVDNDNTSLGFSGSTRNVTTWSTNKMRLTLAGANKSELDPTWAPQWESLASYFKLDSNWTDAVSGTTPTLIGTAAYSTANKRIGTASASLNGSKGALASGTSFGSTQFTAAMWIYTTVSGASAQFLSNQDDSTVGWNLHLTSGDLGFSVEGTDYDLTTYTMPTSTWIHVALTYDGTSFNFYINGFLEKSVATSYTPGSSGLGIGGGFSSGLTTGLSGLIDDVGFWTKALSTQEILLIFKRQSPAYAGSIVSRVMDHGSAETMEGVSWKTTFPVGKPLPSATATESSSDYSSIRSNLMTGLMGLWHLDESDLSMGAVIHDSSGNGRHGTVVTTALSSDPTGKFGSGIHFQKTDVSQSSKAIQIPANLAPNPDDAFSVHFWIKSSTSKAGVGDPFIARCWDQTSGVCWDMKWANHTFYALAGTLANSWYGSIGDEPIDDGKWHNVVAAYNNGSLKLYVDGNLDEAGTYTHGAGFGDSNGPMYIGVPRLDFGYSLAEVAVWERELSDQDVKQLYQRGAGNIRVQVRGCSASDCSDQTSSSKGWKGPSGDAYSYFTEVYNNSQITNLVPTGTTLLSSPDMAFSNFFDFSFTASRYWQYRVFMESESSSSSDSPGLQSITLY